MNIEELEATILGAILTKFELQTARQLSQYDFKEMRNQAIFSTMKDLDDSGIPIDCLTIAEDLKSRGIDSTDYLMKLYRKEVGKHTLPELVAALKMKLEENKRKRI